MCSTKLPTRFTDSLIQLPRTLDTHMHSRMFELYH